MEHRTLRVILSNGKISFDGVKGFSIDLENPELRVNDLYDAVFASIETPTALTVESSPKVANDAKAAEYYKDLKSLIETAAKMINESVAFPATDGSVEDCSLEASARNPG